MRAALGLGLGASLALAGVVAAAETTLTADLAGVTEGENPGDPDGAGSAMIVIDPEAGTVCWELTVEAIEPVTQSHIHAGAEGESGDVVVPLDVDGFEGSSEGCVEDQEADTLQGIVDDQSSFYVNVHTADFPAGAIRGQLVGASEVPNTAMERQDGVTPQALLGVALLALAASLGLRRMVEVRARRG
jgi:hypothetical protein